MKRHHYLILALVLGALFGALLHPYADAVWAKTLTEQILNPIGQIFLRLIFMVVVPVVFCGLCLGVYQLSEHQGLGKVVGKTFFYTIIASSASVLIGVGLANFLKPGAGLILPDEFMHANVDKIKVNAENAKPIMQALVDIIPKNPLYSATQALEGEMLSVMFFALLFGVALSRVYDRKAGEYSILNFFEQVYEASMKIVEYAMRIAPIAVFALVFQSAFKFGHQILISLSYYVLVVLIALFIQQFGVYSILLKLKGISPFRFFAACKEVYLYAFATASSNATLPRTLECAEHKLRLTPETSRFVLTIGSTANQNGTALFEGITVLFLAQVYNIDLTLMQQIQVVLMSILAGIGTAGVPGGSLPLIMILLQQVGIPAEGIGIILGVDRFLDMCRTTLNVGGDLVIAALVDDKKPQV